MQCALLSVCMRLQPAVAAFGVLTMAALAGLFVVDDAFIVARYAQNLVSGGGWAMNPGVPSDGVTGLLWVLPMAIASLAGVNSVAFAQGLGATLGAAAAALVVRRSRGRAGGQRESWAVTALIVVAPQYGIWCSAGLETGAAALLSVTAALAATAPGKPQALPLGLSIFGLAWLRPELALFAAALLGGALLRHRRSGLIALALAASGALSVVALRMVVFGDPLPLSFYAKPGDPSLGLDYVVRGALVLSGGGGLVLVGLSVHPRAGRVRNDRLLTVALAAHLVAVVFAGGDWMPGFRLLVPMVPLYALVAVAPLARFGQATQAGRLGLAGLFVLALTVPLLDAAVQIPRARDAGQVRSTVGLELARYLADIGDSMALVDIGFLAYESGLEVVDLGGVTDRVIARSQGGHLDKVIDVGYLAERNPDLVVLHSSASPELTTDGHVRLRGAFPVEYRVANSPWLRANYRVDRVVPYGPAYHYVILKRR